MSTGCTPADWKEANTTVIFKKGNRQEPVNHKSINLTFVIGKTLERLIKARITYPLDTNNLIKDTQRGFRSKLSCLTNILDFLL